MPAAVHDLEKYYGRTRALQGITFALEPGRVTAFLGPNGAGKTTTLRILVGLAEPSAGEALIGGRRYAELPDPAGTVGAVVDPGFHPARSARNHLRVLAAAADRPPERADACLEAAGLAPVARRKVGEFSTGMRTRLAVAAAMLGEPDVLLLDEPAAGLDPEGVRWLRDMLRAHAAGGGAVLISSHLLAEVAHTADEVVVINRGRLVAHADIGELLAQARGAVRVRTAGADALAEAVESAGGSVERDGEVLLIDDMDAEAVGRLAAERGIGLAELAQHGPALEEAYLALTRDHSEESAR